jgi:hypothetical protein
VIISKDEFRSRFATEHGRLGLGYPHVDAAQADAVLANPSMLDATYDGWVTAQQAMPAAQPPEQAPQQAPYGQSAPQYGQPAPQYGEQPPQQSPYGEQYGTPYGQQPPASTPNGTYFQQPGYQQQPGQSSPYGQQYGVQYQQQAPKTTGTLVMAIISVVAPFLLFGLHVVGTIGLVLGIAALRRSLVLRRMIPVGAPGRGSATAAFVLAIIGIIVGGLSFLEFLANLF